MNRSFFESTPLASGWAWRLGLAMAISGWCPAARPQTNSQDPLGLSSLPTSGTTPVDPYGTSEPVTDYLDQRIPVPPWLSPATPLAPDWSAPSGPVSTFLRPGLGTPSVGGSLLPMAPPTARPRGGSPPIRVGPLDLRPSLGYRVLYGSGLLSNPGQDEATWQHSITPSLAIYAGDHWTVTYTPSVRIYSAEGYENTVDHAISLGGWASWRNWKYRLSHGSSISSDPLLETGTQTDQTTHSTSLGATLDRGERGSFDFSIAQNLRFTDRYSDTYSWSSENWYDYPFRPRLRAGLGIGFGYDMMSVGSDMLNERLNARISGPLSDKFSYTIAGGAEFRQFAEGDASTRVSPIVSADLRYQILRKTSLSLGFNRDVNVSYFDNQFTENNSFQLGANQVLSERWSLSAGGGYRFTTYLSTTGANETQREDNSTFANVSLNGRIIGRVSASVFYSYSANDSDAGDYSYDSHQVGLQLNWSL